MGIKDARVVLVRGELWCTYFVCFYSTSHTPPVQFNETDSLDVTQARSLIPGPHERFVHKLQICKYGCPKMTSGSWSLREIACALTS